MTVFAIRIFFMLIEVGIELGVLALKIIIKFSSYLFKSVWWLLKLGAWAFNVYLNQLSKLLNSIRNYLQQKV